MKKGILIIVLLFTGLITSAQVSKSVYLQFGLATSDLLRSEDLDGAASYWGEQNKTISLFYKKGLNKSFSLEAGLQYAFNTFSIHPAISDPLVCYAPIQERLNMLNISFAAHYSIFKYLSVYAGPIIGFHLNPESIDNQSGLGYSLGVLGKFKIKQIGFRLGPNYTQHSLLPINPDSYQQKLTNVGLEFGVGYQF